jgi:hypothetical protein
MNAASIVPAARKPQPVPTQDGTRPATDAAAALLLPALLVLLPQPEPSSQHVALQLQM